MGKRVNFNQTAKTRSGARAQIAVRFPRKYMFEQGQGGTVPAAAALSVG